METVAKVWDTDTVSFEHKSTKYLFNGHVKFWIVEITHLLRCLEHGMALQTTIFNFPIKFDPLKKKKYSNLLKSRISQMLRILAWL